MTPIRDRDPRWGAIVEHALPTAAGTLRALSVAQPATGTPHLLVHGLGVSSATWLDAMTLLADEGPVVAVDLPGFGGSPPPEGQRADVQTLTSAIGAAIEALGWDRVVLHGNSLGGLLALRHAAGDVDSVERLVLASPALPPGPSGALQVTPAALVGIAPMAVPGIGEAAMWAAGRSGGPFPGAERVGRAVFADPEGLRPSVAQLFADESEGLGLHPWRRRAMLQATRSLLPELAAWWRTDRLVRQLGVPTTVVWGREDGLLPAAILARIRELRPDWEVHELADAGHAPFVERPDAYAAAALGERVPSAA